VAVTWFPELFRAAVCACGMSDLETFYRDTEPWIASAAFPKYGYPIQDGELLKAVSPLVRLSGMPATGGRGGVHTGAVHPRAARHECAAE
jgi:prolyl oligopeptidase PreP (S9A serine peptidase family)